MITFSCIVQEGAIADDLRATLATELARIGADLLGGSAHDISVKFTDVPAGSGFRGGEPSTSSLVSGLIPPGCSPETRHQLLEQIGDMWCEVVGCPPHDLMVSVIDVPEPTSIDRPN